MPPRATWKGHLKMSLVSMSVRLYTATSSSSRVQLNQLSKETLTRVKQKLVDPSTGEDVERDDIVKGYEFEKGKYVVIEPDDLEKIQIESTKTIEIIQFVDAEEIDNAFLDAPYFLAPDGPVAQEAFATFREAMRNAGKVALGRVVLSGRERIVAITPLEGGMRMTTLRYANEVRSPESYFEDIADVEIDEQHVALAEQLVGALCKPFDPSVFADRYNDALLEVIKAKVEGGEPAISAEVEAERTLNFMDALKASLGDAPAATTGSAAQSVPEPAPKKAAKKATKKKAAKKTATKKPPAKSVDTSAKKTAKKSSKRA